MDLPQPIFILSSARSYSSVISFMLGQHKNLYALPELNIFLFDKLDELITASNFQTSSKIWCDINFRLEEIDFKNLNLKAGTLRSVGEVIFKSQSEKSLKKALLYCQEHSSMRAIDFFQHLQKFIAPQHVITKGPYWSGDLEYLNRLPSDALFIHLVRHPKDQYKSFSNLLYMFDGTPKKNIFLNHQVNYELFRTFE